MRILGSGLITSAHAGFGFLDSPSFALTLFVPGFAAGNNFKSSATDKRPMQLPDFEGKSVHFLAIPNPASLAFVHFVSKFDL